MWGILIEILCSPNAPHLAMRPRDAGDLCVADRGTGIPAGKIPYLLERFYRISITKKTEWLGLGLYIARVIVEGHGGKIWVESEVGKGSPFCLSIS